jgi:adenylate kinase family enzyme
MTYNQIMISRLIILRGNSCSGKTTAATRLQQEQCEHFTTIGHGTMLVSQDVIRRDILRVKDGPDNSSIELIYNTVMYGQRIGYDVILEGILAKKHYGEMLSRLINNFEDSVFAYYFDIPFEETLRRHASKPNTDGYGEPELRKWWNDNDYLDIPTEKIFNETLREDDILGSILDDLGSRPGR